MRNETPVKLAGVFDCLLILEELECIVISVIERKDNARSESKVNCSMKEQHRCLDQPPPELTT
jgi:hypothetical protein